MRIGGGIDVSGDRIAWASEMRGEHPAMRPLRTLRLRPGQHFQIPLVGERVGAGFELSGIEGLAPEAFQAVVFERGSGRTFARGRAPADSAGLHLWRVRGIGEGGLFTQRTLRIEVSDPPAQRPRGKHGRH
jgi:hypothetical protein